MAPDRHPGCPGAPPAKVRGHSTPIALATGGSGLVQPGFRSPARIPAAESTRRGLCAAPPSEKRYTLITLYVITSNGLLAKRHNTVRNLLRTSRSAGRHSARDQTQA